MAVIARLQPKAVRLTATSSGATRLDFRGLWNSQIPGWSVWDNSANVAAGIWKINLYTFDPSATITFTARYGTDIIQTYTGTGRISVVFDASVFNNFYVTIGGTQSTQVTMLVTETT